MEAPRGMNAATREVILSPVRTSPVDSDRSFPGIQSAPLMFLWWACPAGRRMSRGRVGDVRAMTGWSWESGGAAAEIDE